MPHRHGVPIHAAKFPQHGARNRALAAAGTHGADETTGTLAGSMVLSAPSSQKSAPVASTREASIIKVWWFTSL
jgi:hypothetical protein